MVVFFAERVGRCKSAEHRVVLAGVEVVEIQAVHAIKLFARILIAVGRRRKDIAEIATCRVRHIGISREANERRDNQRDDMSNTQFHNHKVLKFVFIRQKHRFIKLIYMYISISHFFKNHRIPIHVISIIIFINNISF